MPPKWQLLRRNVPIRARAVPLSTQLSNTPTVCVMAGAAEHLPMRRAGMPPPVFAVAEIGLRVD